MMQNIPASTDAYIASFPPETRALLEQMRAAIKEEAPTAAEIISYAMPAYRLHGNLVYFAGYERHIGFYPGAEAIKVFADDIKEYKSAKGSVQFPLNRPLPLALVRRIVQFRVLQNEEKAAKNRRKTMNSASENVWASLSAPAQRALHNGGVATVADLAERTEKEILSLHGMGKGSLPALRKILADKGLSFKTP